MKIYDALVAKIGRITAKADAQKAAIQAKADAEIAEIQAVLTANEAWLQRDSEVFYQKVSRVIERVREA